MYNIDLFLTLRIDISQIQNFQQLLQFFAFSFYPLVGSALHTHARAHTNFYFRFRRLKAKGVLSIRHIHPS